MRLTVLGACGAWPGPGQACSGFLLEYQGFQLAIDMGYATAPKLFELIPPGRLDAVIISHGHPDHCADLNPLLRARAMSEAESKPLPVYAMPGALDAVLALDRPGMLSHVLDLRLFNVDSPLEIGPLRVDTWLLPHWVPNAGLRFSGGGKSFAYTGDSGPSPAIAELARDVDLFLAEATQPDELPEDMRLYLTDATTAARQAAAAGAQRLLLTHLEPGADKARALENARAAYDGPVDIATDAMMIDF